MITLGFGLALGGCATEAVGARGDACESHAGCASGLLCDCDGTCQPEAEADLSCYPGDAGIQDCGVGCLSDTFVGAC